MIRVRNLLSLLAALLPAVCLLAANPTTRWTGRDRQGQPQEIPAPGKPTVVVFLQPGQRQSELEISEVAPDLAKAKQFCILGVISGPGAGTRIATVDTKQWTWPLLADEAYTISGAFEVNAWPTTIIFDSQGNLAGRIAGHPLSLKNSLATYIAYVSGTLTRAQLDEELTRQQIVQDDADQKAHRHLLIVQQFLTSGRIDDAAAQLQQAQDLAPATEALRLLMARDLLILGQTTQADALLATLDGSSHRGELALLRARSAIASGNWPQAKAYLADAEAQTAESAPPGKAELPYWQGIFYEHEADYRQAADAFRRAYEGTLPDHGIPIPSHQ